MTVVLFRPLGRLVLGLAISTSLAACAVNSNPTPLPEPLRKPLAAQDYNDTLTPEQTAPQQEPRFNATPGSSRASQYVMSESAQLGDTLTGQPISLQVNNFPLPTFINEVFGERLGLSLSISPELQQKEDLVTLRLAQALPPAELFSTARNVLAEYGVDVRERDNVLYFQLADTIANDELPILVSGSALPQVPSSHRPVFQMVPLKVTRSDLMAGWLKEMFNQNKELVINDDRMTNSIMLRGPIHIVRQANDAISLFDVPVLKSSHSLAISPIYSSVDELGNALLKVLQAEGFDASDSPPLSGTLVLKFPELKKLLIFTADATTLSRVRQWAEVLDRESQSQVENGLFIYQVRNTQAAAIANMLGALGYKATVPSQGINSSNSRSAGDGFTENGNTSNSGTQPSNNNSTTTIGGDGEQGSVVVDANRNALIFKGSGQEWVRLRPLLDDLDKAVPSVMIDVLLAEVSLNDKEGLGVDWRNVRTDFGAKNLLMSTANGLGNSGLNLTLNSAGQTRAVLNAFYENRQAVIRSSPKLMVRSGEEARIEVGNEIPVVTGTSQGTENPDAPINKTVQYRKTGVILSIKPTVQASGLVDLEISQELSEQSDTSTSGDVLSPTIMNRKVETSLTLKDGGSVMLAGLISSTKGVGDTGVPILGDIPWLGSFFKSKTASENRTELVVMIIPYVLRNHEDAQDLTERYREQLELNNATILDRRTLHLPVP
ncbi:MAG: secretin N-terminal domain-containing protein [Oceanisphaera sp.]|uniref:type II secretion system protein GspD n=1 Tax=Oceanisphaera sp. TaxID=1929979 RepID=UPI003C77436B